jgi:hypothetical protein
MVGFGFQTITAVAGSFDFETLGAQFVDSAPNRHPSHFQSVGQHAA